MRPVGLLFDAKRCAGCRACVLACREANGQPKTPPYDRPGEKAFLGVAARGDRFVRVSCMHCLDPACVSVCPVAALHRTEDGAVRYRAERCLGCRYCLLACPFGAPAYRWSSAAPVVRKCELCPDRRAAGLPPACAAACPTGALRFGTRDDLIAEARRRLAGGGYVERIYGLEEAGGTSVLLLSDVPFDRLGLPAGVPDEALPPLTWAVLSGLPDVVSGTGVGLAGLWWVVRRRRLLGGEGAHA